MSITMFILNVHNVIWRKQTGKPDKRHLIRERTDVTYNIFDDIYVQYVCESDFNVVSTDYGSM